MGAETEKQPLQYYIDLEYPVTLYPSPEGGYAVEIKDLPGCISQGETIEEAMEMIEEARRQWLEVVYEDDEMTIPLPEGKHEYSGNVYIRAPKSLHKQLDRMAVREGVSLNQFVVSTLSQAVGYKEASLKKPKTVSKRK